MIPVNSTGVRTFEFAVSKGADCLRTNAAVWEALAPDRSSCASLSFGWGIDCARVEEQDAQSYCDGALIVQIADAHDVVRGRAMIHDLNVNDGNLY